MTAPEKVLVFEIAGQSFAADVTNVREVLRPPPISPLPRARPPVKGVFNLRGSVVTAVDGGEAMGLEDAPPDTRARAVVAEADGRLLGILVDAAIEVRRIQPEDVRDPRDVGDLRAEPVRGVVLLDDRPVILLDLTRLTPGKAPSTTEQATPGSTNP